LREAGGGRNKRKGSGSERSTNGTITSLQKMTGHKNWEEGKNTRATTREQKKSSVHQAKKKAISVPVKIEVSGVEDCRGRSLGGGPSCSIAGKGEDSHLVAEGRGRGTKNPETSARQKLYWMYRGGGGILRIFLRMWK